MPVRFKSEYQQSYGPSRSRSVSPQRRRPLDGLRSHQMGIRRPDRPGPLGAARSCSSLLGSPVDPVPRRAPSVGGSVTDSPAPRSGTEKKASKAPKFTGSAPEHGPPAGPRPAADAEPPGPEPGSSQKLAIDRESVKLRPSERHRPAAVAEPDEQPGGQVDPTLQWRPEGQRSAGHRSEYHRQFGWKKPGPPVSPLLTAEQVLHSSSRSVPPFKKNPVSMETEYRRSFQGLMPPSGPRLRRHLERQRVPLFHTHNIRRRRRSLEPQRDGKDGSSSPPRTTAAQPPAQVQRGRRNPEGGGASGDFTKQVKELRRQADAYRRRAWGTNFSRKHLSQLLSDYNAVWEPTDTSGSSHSPPSTPPPDVEALHLASNSSRRSSVGAAGTETPPGSEAGRHTAWGDEEEEKDEQEGRLPTPKLRTRPVQRTHHDLTTPATGGAILVGKRTEMEDSSPSKQKQSFGTPVSSELGSDVTVDRPTRMKEAWPENRNTPMSVSPASSPQPKPSGTKQASPLPCPPQHGIMGTLRHPDFQHNGELGLRLREPPCCRGGCGSDEDDRLSVMSWRSAASCSAASAILERAQKRREDFWGKR